MAPSSSLVEVFLAHAPAGLAASADRSSLEPYLRHALEAARALWPAIPLAEADFVRHVAERVPSSGEGRTPEQLLESLHLGDLYLACACSRKVQGAAALLEREHLAKIPGVLRHRKCSPELIEDIYQKVSEKLLLKGHISTYSGVGGLWSWIEVIAKRMANKEARATASSESSGLSGIIEALPDTGDPERELVKKTLMAELQAAVRSASSALSDEQRALLKFQYRDGLSEAKLARLYNTSQPTISRRLKGAREVLLGETERLLRKRHGLTRSDFESFIAEVRSRWLDLSLGRIFDSSDDSGR